MGPIKIVFKEGVTLEQINTTLGFALSGEFTWRTEGQLMCVFKPEELDITPDLITRVFHSIVESAETIYPKEGLLDHIMREEYAGCNPMKDKICKIWVRVNREIPGNAFIEYYVVGKWRSARYYGGRKNVITNKKIMAEVEKTLRCNTSKTFENREIQWKWRPVITR